MNLPLKIIGTIVFVIFGALCTQAVLELGFGWPAAALAVLSTILMLNEMWIVGSGHPTYRDAILAEIEGYRGERIKTPQNIMDARDLVETLSKDRELLANAYIELHSQLPEDKEET